MTYLLVILTISLAVLIVWFILDEFFKQRRARILAGWIVALTCLIAFFLLWTWQTLSRCLY